MNLKKGDKVVVVESRFSSRDNPCNRTVLSVGRKWIVVDDGYGRPGSRWAVDCDEGDADSNAVSCGYRKRLYSSWKSYDAAVARSVAIRELFDAQRLQVRNPLTAWGPRETGAPSTSRLIA